MFSVQVATDVIREFAADGVRYLELRSTPREEKTTGKKVNMVKGILIGWFLIWLTDLYSFFVFVFPRIN